MVSVGPPDRFWRWFLDQLMRMVRSSLDSWGRTIRLCSMLAVAAACIGYVLAQLAPVGVSILEEVSALTRQFS